MREYNPIYSNTPILIGLQLSIEGVDLIQLKLTLII